MTGSNHNYDAVIVGSGPNGLAAAITMARKGLSVLVIEGQDTIGGGTRTAELTLPGFWHDVCSAIHPLGMASPFMRSLPLAEYGLEWVIPPAAVAHPLDDAPAVMIERSLEQTTQGLGNDQYAYLRLVEPLVANWEKLTADLLGPFPLPPKHPFLDLAFGIKGISSARGLAERRFKAKRARAVLAGMAGHAIMPLEKPLTAAFGLMMFMLSHAVGWPLARGGSTKITEAMAAYLRSLGGEIQTGWEVKSLDALPRSRAVFLSLSPRAVLGIAGERLPAGYRRQLNGYRYGPALFKVDWALDGPIPWKDPAVLRSATVHLGGTLEEIAASERQVWAGEHSEQPYIILAQQSLFDDSRAPEGKHTAWAYCHVPNGSTVDMTAQIEAQVERFAPGFRDLILARFTRNPLEMEAYNPNYVGGDINVGVQDIRQFFTRPTLSLVPYATPLKGLYLCSSATPPGGGVHGMCGYHAAQVALRRDFR
ncbi:MAG TPA: NAD(P)/FAD-dependent oxidoreductase [Anaerolineales bacterium]|nr:NAD(P)/FAD-dependent oxidoreductase [Anaerolineales bacterium]